MDEPATVSSSDTSYPGGTRRSRARRNIDSDLSFSRHERAIARTGLYRSPDRRGVSAHGHECAELWTERSDSGRRNPPSTAPASRNVLREARIGVRRYRLEGIPKTTAILSFLRFSPL